MSTGNNGKGFDYVLPVVAGRDDSARFVLNDTAMGRLTAMRMADATADAYLDTVRGQPRCFRASALPR
jgi:hypothetical protein